MCYTEYFLFVLLCLHNVTKISSLEPVLSIYCIFHIFIFLQLSNTWLCISTTLSLSICQLTSRLFTFPTCYEQSSNLSCIPGLRTHLRRGYENMKIRRMRDYERIPQNQRSYRLEHRLERAADAPMSISVAKGSWWLLT